MRVTVSVTQFENLQLNLDTESLYTKATQEILDQFGKTYTWEVKMTLMGLRHIEMCKRIVEIYELPLTPEEYSKLQREKNSKIMLNAQLMPGNSSKMTAELMLFFCVFVSFPFFLFSQYFIVSWTTDTEAVYEEVIRQIAQAYNKSYPLETRLKLLGTTEPRTAEIVVTDLALPISTHEFLEQFHKLCRAKLSECPLKKG